MSHRGPVFLLSKPTGYHPALPQERRVTVRNVVHPQETPVNNRLGEIFLEIALTKESHRPPGAQRARSASIRLTPSEAEDLAVALQVFARGLHNGEA